MTLCAGASDGLARFTGTYLTKFLTAEHPPVAGPEFVITPRGSSFSVQLDGVEAPATTFDASNVLSWQGDPAADGKWIDGWSGEQWSVAACGLL